MAWLRRAASAANTRYDVATELTVALAPSIRRVRKLEAQGTPANGVITGVRFSLDNDTTRKEFAISVIDGGPPRRIGVRAQPVLAHRLRLGMPVVVRLDGDRGILDATAMANAWSLPSDSFPQEALRTPPDDGVDDKTLDARVQRRLAKWQPIDATIVSIERRTMMGMPTLNWDVTLQLPDGGIAVSTKDEVPSYAQWDAMPGMAVPAVIDPRDRSKASINWPAFAHRRFETVGFDDDPPTGSIAAMLEVAAGSGASSVAAVNAPVAPAGHMAGEIVLDATMRSWINARRDGYMSQKDFDKSLADWHAAGMCTEAHIATARAEFD